MAGSDAFATLDQEQSKSSRTHRWREKIFKERGKVDSTEKQLDDFLGQNRATKPNPQNVPPVPISKNVITPQVLPPAPPRIDVALVYAHKETDLFSAILPVSSGSPPSISPSIPKLDNASLHNDANSFRKPRRRPGLRVVFTEAEPEIIGEGGGDSEDPTIEISYNRNNSHTVKHDTHHHQEPDFSHLYDRQPTLPNLGFGDGFVSNPTRPEPGEALPLLLNPQDVDFLNTLSVATNGSKRLSFRATAESNSVAKKVQARMQEEEGLALQRRLDSPQSPPKGEKNSSIISHQDDLACRSVQGSLRPSSPSSPSSEYDDSSSPPRMSLSTNHSPIVHDPPRSLRLSPTGLSSGSSEPSLVSPSDSRLGTPGSPYQHHHSRPESRHDTSPPPPPAHQTPLKLSLRSLANAVGENAYGEFTSYASRYTASFQNSGETARPFFETTFPEWVRAATWWFLRGRTSLETTVRSARPPDPHSSSSPQASSEKLEQAVVDLAKAWWICEQVLPQHPTLTRYGQKGIDALVAVMTTTGDSRNARLVNMQQKIMHHVKALATSMKRNNVLNDISAISKKPGLKLDTEVWLRYPSFTPDVAAILSGAVTTQSLYLNTPVPGSLVRTDPPDMMLISDTSQFFSYGNMFVQAYVTAGLEEPTQTQPIPCVLTIMRNRTEWYVQAAIASQVEILNVKIQADRKQGPTWDDVKWDVKSCSMRVKLQRGLTLNILFLDKDFKIIWNIVQYTLKTQADLQPEEGEELIFENVLKVFQYMDASPSRMFPTEPVPQCHVRLFEKSIAVTEGTGSRRSHRGYRLAVVSGSQVKSLSAVYHRVGEGAPIVFGLLRGDGGAPALMLHVTEKAKTTSMVMTFNNLDERALMHSLLLGMLARDQEIHTSEIPFRSFSIEQPPEVDSPLPAITHVQFSSGNVSVIDKPRSITEHGHLSAILSENLRALVASDWGTVTDRINLSPGELKIGLDVQNHNAFYVLRSQQADLTVSVAENLVRKDLPDRLTEFLRAAKMKTMIRRYEFTSLEGLHRFQLAVTGYQVVFDGVASSFTIVRRQKLVSIHKKWEATSVRLQILQYDKSMQLLAFFEDFSHGKCMNFVLKGTDVLENLGKSSRPGVRFVDAKFPLPRSGTDIESQFVCLDVPDYPSEHDDIIITFDSDAESAALATLAVHADGVCNYIADVAPPIQVSTNYRYSENPDDLVTADQLRVEDISNYYVYSRLASPSSTRFETILSALLNGRALAYSSGLSAFHAALVLFNPRNVSIGENYHGCHGVLDIMSRLTGVKKLALDCPAEALGAGDVILLETPLNPHGTAFNIEFYSKKAHSRGAYLIVDSTFAPPGLQDPFLWGADIVMHSGSKYFGGHSDMICGVLATQKDDWWNKLIADRVYLGNMLGNLELWLGVRSLRTLELRVQRASENAEKIVSFLHGALTASNSQPPSPGSAESIIQQTVYRINHASLQVGDAEWLRKQMPNGYGPVFSIIMHREQLARLFPSKLRYFHHATSLGAVESLIEWRAMSDTRVDRRLLRVSIGVENWEDLRDDLVRGLKEILISSGDAWSQEKH